MGPDYLLELVTGRRDEDVNEGTQPSFFLSRVCSDRGWGAGNGRRGRAGGSLGDAGAADVWGAHLCEHLVQPLQGAVEVQLDPAGGAGHRLSPAGHNQCRC